MTDKVKYTLEHLHAKELGQKKPPFNMCVSFVAFLWSLLQLWIASPIQYDVASYLNMSWLLLSDAQMRFIHLALGMFLVFFLFPIHSYKAPIVRFLSTTQNLIFSILGGFSALYLFIFYEDIARTIGMASDIDVMISIMGILILLEAARRTVGIAMTITAGAFLGYSYFGHYMPDIIAHSGQSLSAIASHMWLSSEGVFGTPLGVSVDFIFLYVLFGSLLEKTGAGNFFVQLAFSLLGRFKAGPAKAAVVASGLMGMISGSSIANTITVGSITIPLMKKMGLSAEKSASIEVSAGVNGQVTPPIMGAAAFLIAEYLAMPYYEIVKIAFLPSLLTYCSLLYIVHIEGCKINMKTLPVYGGYGGFWSVIRFLISFTSVILVLGLLYYVIEGFDSFIGIKKLLGDYYVCVMMVVLASLNVFLAWHNSKFPLLSHEINYETPLRAKDVLKGGLQHFIPLIILIWCLIIEKLSPALSAFWSILFLLFELLTSKLWASIFAKQFSVLSLKDGLYDVINAMVSGAKSMIIVSIATAVAGIIVGAISLTGVGLKITSILDYLSNSSVVVTLLLTALTCIILGMGMPTTACYIIVSTLMIPALDYFIKKHDLDVPLFSLHLFVFYFGLMADVTPPVGLASYAAAAIAHANALKTGIVAFSYNIKTMLLPFFFIFNPAILLYKVDSSFHVICIFVTSIIGILAITASTQQYFIIKNKIYETVLLCVIGVGFLSPQVLVDIVFPKFTEVKINSETLHMVNSSSKLRMMLRWENFSGEMENGILSLNADSNSSLLKQLNDFGIDVYHTEGNKFLEIAAIYDGSEAFKRIDGKSNYKIVKLYFFNKQPSKNFAYLVSVLLLIGIYWLQLKRSKKVLNNA